MHCRLPPSPFLHSPRNFEFFYPPGLNFPPYHSSSGFQFFPYIPLVATNPSTTKRPVTQRTSRGLIHRIEGRTKQRLEKYPNQWIWGWLRTFDNRRQCQFKSTDGGVFTIVTVGGVCTQCVHWNVSTKSQDGGLWCVVVEIRSVPRHTEAVQGVPDQPLSGGDEDSTQHHRPSIPETVYYIPTGDGGVCRLKNRGRIFRPIWWKRGYRVVFWICFLQNNIIFSWVNR